MKAITRFARPAIFALSSVLTLSFLGALSAQEPTAAPMAAESPAAPVAPAVAPIPEAPTVPRAPDRPARRSDPGEVQDLVRFGSDAVLEREEIADQVVAIGGSVITRGEARRAVVAIAGNATAEGPVGEDVVAIFGNASAAARVRDGVVAILGNARAEGHVGRDVVAILGDVELGPDAVVDGQAVSIGGTVRRAPGATIRGGERSFSAGRMPDFSRYQGWVRQCLLFARPLAFSGRVGWAWGVAGSFLLLYLLFAWTAGGAMEKCLVTLREHPGRTVLATLLALVLTPLILVIVAVTGVGLLVEPLLALGILAAGLFGRAVLLAWLGRGLLRPFGLTVSLVASVAVGGVLVALLYTIPVVGFLLWKLLGAFGFGLVVYTVILGLKRERPVETAAAPAAPVAGMPMPPVVPGGDGFVAPEASPLLGLVPVAAPTPPPTAAPASPATTWPRAGFWRRLLALALDALLIGLLTGPWSHGTMVLPALALYAACLWKARGTTIGGIIFGLKVVRMDDRPVDWTTAIVRALACFISLFVVFLGFFWVAFDAEKQAWHDKIAGTVVVRAPRGMSLI